MRRQSGVRPDAAYELPTRRRTSHSLLSGETSGSMRAPLARVQGLQGETSVEGAAGGIRTSTTLLHRQRAIGIDLDFEPSGPGRPRLAGRLTRVVLRARDQAADATLQASLFRLCLSIYAAVRIDRV